MTVGKRIAENTIYLIFGRICAGLFYLITMALLARFLGVAYYGKYTFAIAYLAFFNMLSVFGIDTVLIREISRDNLSASRLLGCGMIIKGFFSALSLLLAVVIVFLLKLPHDTSKVICILSLSIAFNVFQTPKVIFEVYLKSQYIVLIDFINKLITLSLVYIATLYDFSLIGVVYIILLSQFMGLIVLTMVSRKFIDPVFVWDLKTIKYLLKESWPIALMAVFIVIYFRVDTIMLSFIKGDEAVGYYNGAYIIMTSLLLLPDAYVRSVFPVMSDFFKTKPHHIAKTFSRSFKYLGTVALPIVCVGAILSEDIILFIFGNSFHHSVRAFQILIFAAGIIFISNLVSMTLTAMNKQKVNMWLALVNVISNIILNLMLIPRWSYIGASIATVITEGLGCLIAFFVNIRNLKIPLFSLSYLRCIRLFIAVGATVFVIKLLHGMHLLIIIPLAAFIYVVSLFLVQWFDTEDKEMFKQIVKGHK